jgi:transposase, IS30 family
MAHKGYRHLSYENRCQIHALKKSGIPPSSIATVLGVNKSTITREIQRNSGDAGYRFKQAQRLSESRRSEASRAPLKMTADCIDLVEEKLAIRWSPVQISGWMKLNLGYSVSHERIYQHIWRDKKDGGNLYKYLRHGRKKYNKRSGKNAGRGCIPGRVDIDERPKIVEQKQRIGDWELDTIIGKDHHGAIVSMVDRASKFTKLMLVPNKTAEIVTSAIAISLGPLKPFVLTMTADNGKEFAAHDELKQILGAQVYFAKPYHSWERGLNEHTNGLVRQYFPKGTRFDRLSQDDVQKVESQLNGRPRKILDFQTPMEVFSRSFPDLSGGAFHC